MERKRNSFEKADLVIRHLRGELNPEEEAAFLRWQAEDPQNEKFLESLRQEQELTEQVEFFAAVDAEAAWKKVAAKTHPEDKVTPWWQTGKAHKYAAAFLFLLLSSVVLYQLAAPPEVPKVATVDAGQMEYKVEPGSDKAKLTLADGTELLLEYYKNGTIREESGIRITKRDGQVLYQVTGDHAGKGGHHTLSTPKGGQYQLVLPDGSKVWLNAASSLRFPTAFTSTARQVELVGEGYFEVAKNTKMPFHVSAEGTTVEVLGTHFNVTAYPTERIHKTTLVEGSVAVRQGAARTVITPGQQARVRTASIEVAEVDVEEVIAWKEGFFQFENADFASVAHQLERWYDVEFVYAGALPDKHFSGVIPRTTRLAKVLEMLELSGSVHFKLKGRRIMVQAKK